MALKLAEKLGMATRDKELESMAEGEKVKLELGTMLLAVH